jgi:hypothetical protein
MPTVMFIELRNMLRKDVRSRISDASAIAESLGRINDMLWEFEAVGSECSKNLEELKKFDEKITNNSYIRKVLKQEGYTIARIDRLKQDLNQIQEQVGNYTGDPRIFRDRLNRIVKHIRVIQELIKQGDEQSLHGKNKGIIALVIGLILAGLMGFFLVRPYMARKTRNNNQNAGW